MEQNIRLRLLLAAVIVALGFVFLTPSFDFDSDGDGVADIVEIYELGSDPSSPDAFEKPSQIAVNGRR